MTSTSEGLQIHTLFGRLQCCIQQVPIRAFMDELTVTARSVTEGRWTLEDLVEVTKVARNGV